MATEIIADGSASYGMPGSGTGASHLLTIGSASCPRVYEGPDGEKLVECGRCGICGDCARRCENEDYI